MEIIGTDYYTIIDNKKTWYTYSLYVDSELEKYIDDVMKKRGNWKKVKNQNATWIYVYSDELNKMKDSWKYNAYIKNNLHRYRIPNKSELYNLFINYNRQMANKFMCLQYDITIKNYCTAISKDEFEKIKLWILKPVMTWGGKGIHILDNYNSFIEIMKENEKDTKNSWVLSEYIDDPLLFRNRKFHFRVPYLYFDNMGYVGRKFSIITANKEYVHGNYNDKDIHDTHIKKSIKNIFFPEDFDQNLVNEINNQVIELFYHITNIMNSIDSSMCYQDSKKCYIVAGADIMITNTYQIKLLELNINAGFTGFIHDVIEGELSNVIDNIIPPENKTNENNFFINVNMYSRKKEYMNKYYKYKKKYMVLKRDFR